MLLFPRAERTIVFRTGPKGDREGIGIPGGRRKPYRTGEWSQEVIGMNWFVDVFDRESVRRETLRCANECSLTMFRQINEMSNR